MPSPNSIKNYQADSYYHLYNRGVNKMEIFKKDEDYEVLLHYLRIIFSPVKKLEQELLDVRTNEHSWGNRSKSLTRAIIQSLKSRVYENVELLSFSLMPNHFHLLVFQKVKNGIEMLMRRLATSYSVYFAKEYQYIGPVFCRPYKASHLTYDPEVQALAAFRYIEQNPLQINHSEKTPRTSFIYRFSSLQYYLAQEKEGKAPPLWLKTNRLQEIFAQIKEKPNCHLQEIIAKHHTLTDFVLSEEDFSLEDVRLDHLASLN